MVVALHGIALCWLPFWLLNLVTRLRWPIVNSQMVLVVVGRHTVTIQESNKPPHKPELVLVTRSFALSLSPSNTNAD